MLAGNLWKAEDLIALVGSLDLSPGWYLRSRRELARALRRFLRNPDRAGLQAVERILFLYWLATVVFSYAVVGDKRRMP
jgi:hypothetical protein